MPNLRPRNKRFGNLTYQSCGFDEHANPTPYPLANGGVGKVLEWVEPCYSTLRPSSVATKHLYIRPTVLTLTESSIDTYGIYRSSCIAMYT